MTQAESRSTPPAEDLSPRSPRFRPSVADLMVVVLMAAVLFAGRGRSTEDALTLMAGCGLFLAAVFGSCSRSCPKGLAMALMCAASAAAIFVVLDRINLVPSILFLRLLRTFGRPVHWFAAAAVIASSAGPAIVAGRAWLGRTPTSGGALWACLGFSWMMCSGRSQLMVGRYEDLAGCATVAAVAALGVARWGRRPAEEGERLIHLAGWYVAEANAIALGLLALEMYPYRFPLGR